MSAYYNEIDPYCAEWLRNLTKAGLIAPGDVDERDIKTVDAADVRGYTQCHWFAGIGGFSYALRLAGWEDDRAVWTGSCPCQPFSVAGRGEGFDDPRHLWPAFRRLIAECRPAVCFGEQVASKDGRLWLARVRSDLEESGYGVGCADLCSASVGAPHIRQRLFWVASRDRQLADSGRGSDERGMRHRAPYGTAGGAQGEGDQRERRRDDIGGDGAVERMADPEGGRLGIDGSTPGEQRYPDERSPGRMANPGSAQREGQAERRESEHESPAGRLGGSGSRLVDANGAGCREQCGTVAVQPQQPSAERAGDPRTVASGLGNANSPERRAEAEGRNDDIDRSDTGRAETSSGFGFPRAPHPAWRDYVWLPCLDGKARRIEPSIAPLAVRLPPSMGCDGTSETSPFRVITDPETGKSIGQEPWRIGMLRAYGNSISPQVAAEFIAAFMECQP